MLFKSQIRHKDDKDLFMVEQAATTFSSRVPVNLGRDWPPRLPAAGVTTFKMSIKMAHIDPYDIGGDTDDNGGDKGEEMTLSQQARSLTNVSLMTAFKVTLMTWYGDDTDDNKDKKETLSYQARSLCGRLCPCVIDDDICMRMMLKTMVKLTLSQQARSLCGRLMAKVWWSEPAARPRWPHRSSASR